MMLIFIIYHLKIRILLQTKIFSFDRKTVSVKRSKIFCFDWCVPSTVCDSVAIHGNQTIYRFEIRCFMTRLYRNFSLSQFTLCLKIAHLSDCAFNQHSLTLLIDIPIAKTLSLFDTSTMLYQINDIKYEFGKIKERDKRIVIIYKQN